MHTKNVAVGNTISLIYFHFLRTFVFFTSISLRFGKNINPENAMKNKNINDPEMMELCAKKNIIPVTAPTTILKKFRIYPSSNACLGSIKTTTNANDAIITLKKLCWNEKYATQASNMLATSLNHFLPGSSSSGATKSTYRPRTNPKNATSAVPKNCNMDSQYLATLKGYCFLRSGFNVEMSVS
jgi:hypothetical protein